MEIVVNATTEEKLGVVHSALCSGLPYFVSYGYQLLYKNADYDAAFRVLKDTNAKGRLTDTICIEDVQTQMLRMGFRLTFKGDEKEGGEAKTAILTLNKIKRNWKKVPAKLILEFIAEDDDANSSDRLMQYLLLGDEIYG